MIIPDQQQAIGIFGGTFDPVHIGHLRAAIEFAEAFSLADVRLLPCHQPPHREMPGVSSEQRKIMLELAVKDIKQLSIDDREILQDQTSYTIHSLRQIRSEVGEKIPLYFALGVDAFNQITTWKNWQELFHLSNFVILHRPNAELNIANSLPDVRLEHFDGVRQPANHLYELAINALDISSTAIRQKIAAKQSVKFLLPETVEEYIFKNKLYR